MTDTPSSTPKKGRGRPKGKTRDIYCVCFAQKNKKFIKMRVVARNESEAIAAFEAKEPEAKLLLVDGPFYEVASLRNDVGRAQISLDFSEMNFTNSKYVGEIRGYQVNCNGLEALEYKGKSYDDNELVRVTLGKPIDEGKKLPKPRIKPGTVMRRKDIDNLQEV